MPDPLLSSALGKAAAAAEKLGLFQKLLSKLLGDPSLAAQQLGVALTEVRRTLGSLRETMLEIRNLGVRGQDPDDVRRALRRIESGELYEEVIRAKGSCHKIGNIYDRYLDAWFTKVLKPDEASELRVLFTALRNSDGWAVDAQERLLREAKPLVTEISALLNAGGEDAAIRRVKAFSASFAPTLERLSATMAVMLELEANFILLEHIT